MRRALALLIAATACNTSTDTPVDDTDDTDVSCAYERPERPAAGALKAGIARRRIPAPVGIGTAGFGPFGAPSSPSPFADLYPGTTRVHGHPEVKVVVLTRGPGHDVVFVRLDAIGVFAQLRREIVLEASERVGRDLDHAILLGATHTHSGPARVLNTGGTGTSPYDFIADTFFPEFYDRFVDAVAGAIADAYDDLEDARVGTTIATCDEGHSDRRCDDGEDYQNPKLPLVVVERGGEVEAVVMSYAIHGTIFGIDELFLSQDVSGAIEEAVEDRFDHPVEAVMFNAWAGDMAPGSASSAPTQISGISDGGFQQQRRVGHVVADAVEEALDDLVWTTEPRLELETHRVAINRDLLGYDAETFPYEYGAVYCEGGSDCDPPRVRDEALDEKCLIRFPEEYPAPTQTDVTVGRIADLAVVTFPGEAGTRLAERLMDDVLADMPDATDVLFLGYTQDYLGYSILEEDWWFGGYEASGALWGPRQGEHLWHEIAADFESFATDTCPASEPGALHPFPYTIDTPYVSEGAIDAGEVVTQPDEVHDVEDVIRFAVNGADPWEGAPLAWLETEGGQALTRANGVRVDSDDHNWEVRLATAPTYADAERSDRTFTWTFLVPVRQPVAGGFEIPAGDYVMKVQLPGVAEPVTSDTFTVLPVAAAR